MACEVDARDEAAHRMAEDDMRDIRQIALPHQFAKRVHVLHQHVLATLERHVAEVRLRGGRLAMAHVIVRADDEALAHEVLREGCVALDVLCHAVDELHHGARREVRLDGGVWLPEKRADGRGAIVAWIRERGGEHAAS